MVDVPLRFDDLRTYGGGGAQTVSLQGKLREVVETIKYKQDNEMVNVGNLDNIQKISIMSIQCSDSDMKRVEDFLIFICAAVFGVAVGAVIELLVALTKSAFPAAPVPTDFPSGDRFGRFSRLNSHWCAAWEGRSFCPTKTFPFCELPSFGRFSQNLLFSKGLGAVRNSGAPEKPAGSRW